MNVADLVDKYLEHLKLEKNYSPRTLESYAHYLTRFLQWTGVNALKDLSPTLIRDYQIKLYDFTDERGGQLTPKTRNYHLIALRGFLRYLIVERGMVDIVPPEKVALGRISEREISVLEEGDLAKLMAAPNSQTRGGRRDRALLETLFSTGLRVSELVSLNREQINLETGEFSVLGKGGRRRVVFLSERATATLADYLQNRHDDYQPLFIRFRGPKVQDTSPNIGVRGEGWRLSARGVQRLVKKYVRRAGLPLGVTPHTLRHSFATDLLRGGADVREVQELLGHKNIATTQIYTHVTDRRLKEVFRKSHSGNK